MASDNPNSPSLLRRVKQRYRDDGFHGVGSALQRRLFLLSHPVKMALKKVLRCDDFTIIQIGAHVGNTENDPIFRTIKHEPRSNRGCIILVEPVKEYFDKLVENYQGVPDVYFENVAISDHSGPATFYRLGVDAVEHGYPEFLNQLSSLKEERMRDLWDKYEANFCPEKYKEFYLDHRIEDTVECLTFNDLLKRYGRPKIDLLQIDAEGYDFEILKTINFTATPIRFVNYESVLLHERKEEAQRFMEANGFRLIDYGQDTFCYRNNDQFLWRQLIKWMTKRH